MLFPFDPHTLLRIYCICWNSGLRIPAMLRQQNLLILPAKLIFSLQHFSFHLETLPAWFTLFGKRWPPSLFQNWPTKTLCSPDHRSTEINKAWLVKRIPLDICWSLWEIITLFHHSSWEDLSAVLPVNTPSQGKNAWMKATRDASRAERWRQKSLPKTYKHIMYVPVSWSWC